MQNKKVANNELQLVIKQLSKAQFGQKRYCHILLESAATLISLADKDINEHPCCRISWHP